MQPKIAALIFSDPNAKNVFLAVKGDTQHHIGRLGLIATLFLDLLGAWPGTE